MKKVVGLISILILIITLGLSACSGESPGPVTVAGPAGSPVPVVNPADPYAWFDKPLDGFEIPRQPYEIVLHGSAYAGIAAIELRITGEPVLTFDHPATGATLVTLRHTWTPAKAGRYVLQVRTRDSKDQWSQTAVVAVIVVEAATPSPTLIPTVTAPPAPLAGFTQPVFSPDAIALKTSCEPKKVIATIGATDPDGVKVVAVFYRLVDKATGDTTGWANTAMQPLGGDQYRIDLQPGPPGSEILDFAIHHYDVQGDSFAAWVQMQFAIQTNSGKFIRSQVFNATTMYYCAP